MLDCHIPSMDGMHVQYQSVGSYLLASTVLFNVYGGSSMISALPVGLCCKTLSADMDWDANRYFMVMFCW